MSQSFDLFIKKMAGSFRSIVKATKYTVSIEDLYQDAWILADEIGTKRGQPVDFSDAEDQSLILRAINARNVKWADCKIRYALRLDQDPDEETNAINWSEILPADQSSDPLISLLSYEAECEIASLIANRFAEAIAYLFTFDHFNNDRKKVCSHLAIADTTLSNRINRAAQTIKEQSSLFDGIEKIAHDFLPLAGPAFLTAEMHTSNFEQLNFEF